MSSETLRARIFISGIVQGVGFRYTAFMVAKRLGLKGYVRNLPDGRVEAVVEGRRDKVEKFINWCHEGPPAAVVEDVKVNWEKPRGDFDNFDIII